jgi:hypothetical protein
MFFRGIVIYREPYLLHDEKISTTSQQDLIVRLIAHEFTVSNQS